MFIFMVKPPCPIPELYRLTKQKRIKRKFFIGITETSVRRRRLKTLVPGYPSPQTVTSGARPLPVQTQRGSRHTAVTPRTSPGRFLDVLFTTQAPPVVVGRP